MLMIMMGMMTLMMLRTIMMMMIMLNTMKMTRMKKKTMMLCLTCGSMLTDTLKMYGYGVFLLVSLMF